MENDIRLEPFGREDIDRLLAWIPDADFLMQWAGPFFTPPLDRPQLEAYLASAQVSEPPRMIFRAARGGEVVGHIELNNIDRRNRAASVSKVLVRADLRGQGIGAWMVRRLAGIAFDEQRLHRLSLYVFDWNAGAIRCYEKIGFQREGHLRDYRRVGDGYWSSVLMALLEDDWRKRP
jgi:RimJ/RimL family protein N-acetyltransferase